MSRGFFVKNVVFLVVYAIISDMGVERNKTNNPEKTADIIISKYAEVEAAEPEGSPVLKGFRNIITNLQKSDKLNDRQRKAIFVIGMAKSMDVMDEF